MNQTLIIEKVNFDALDNQRHALNRTLEQATDYEIIPKEDVEHVQGIINMLEHWSDKRYHEARGQFSPHQVRLVWGLPDAACIDFKCFDSLIEVNAYLGGIGDADGWTDYHADRLKDDGTYAPLEESTILSLIENQGMTREEIEGRS